jgi:hypothetical protein
VGFKYQKDYDWLDLNSKQEGGSCITGNDVTGNDVTRYDVTGTGSREPETGNDREIISRVYPVFPSFSPELL